MNRQAPKDLFSSSGKDEAAQKPIPSLPDLSIPTLAAPSNEPLPNIPQAPAPFTEATPFAEATPSADEEENDLLAWEREPVATPEVRKAMENLHTAGAPETQMATIYAYATSTDPSVREQVAYNPAATPELLNDLAHDTDPNVRAAVIQNPNTSDATYDSFANDTDEYVLSAYIKSDRTTRVKLTAMKNHHDEFVAYMAESELEQRAANL